MMPPWSPRMPSVRAISDMHWNTFVYCRGRFADLLYRRSKMKETESLNDWTSINGKHDGGTRQPTLSSF